MIADSTSVIQETPAAEAQTAPGAWQQLWLRLRGVTPAALVRFVLGLVALAVIGWLVWSTWIVLTPFLAGGVIAYTVLPLVNRLDRFLPRLIAILLALSLVAGLVILFFALLVPIVGQQIYAAYLALPGLEEIRAYVSRLDQYLATLPEPTQAVVANLRAQAVAKVQANAQTYLNGLVNLVINTTLGLVNTLGFILGFLVVPAWVLMVLQDQRQASRAINRLLPDWLRADFWAVLRILDRAFGAFLRGQLLTALVVAGLTFLGLELLVRLMGLQNALRYQLLLAMIAGLTQLIPSIGPFLGAIPAVLIGLSVSTQLGLLIIVTYIIVQQIVAYFVAPRVERNVIDIHPALMIMIVVALSQIGFWWVLLATPITAITTNLYRYVYGRFSDPPRPAGLLPDEPLPAVPAQPAPEMVPLVYRRGRAGRRSA